MTSASMTSNAFISDVNQMSPAWKEYLERNGTQFHESELSRVAVIGGGAFGTALATVAARKGARARVWVRDAEHAKVVNESRKNEKYFGDSDEFTLPETVHFTADIAECCDEAQLVLLAIPTPFLRAFLVEHLRAFPYLVPILVAAKGIEQGSLETPYEIAMGELPGRYGKWLGALAGPSFAREMMMRCPTNVVCAAEDPAVAFIAAALMSSRKASFRCYPQPDVMGCEIAGAVKNVLAIAAGAADRLGLGNNGRVGMICRGLAEMKRLALAVGSSGAALSGLAGTGDVCLTCSSALSRNYKVGQRLAVDGPIGGAAGEGIAEGVLTAKSIHLLSAKLGIHCPISEAVFEVIYEKKSVKEALAGLVERPLSLE